MDTRNEFYWNPVHDPIGTYIGPIGVVVAFFIALWLCGVLA